MACDGGGLLASRCRRCCFHSGRRRLSSCRSNKTSIVPVVFLPRRFCGPSMAYKEKSNPSTVESSKHKIVPVFVMMPIDTFGFNKFGIPQIERSRTYCTAWRTVLQPRSDWCTQRACQSSVALVHHILRWVGGGAKTYCIYATSFFLPFWKRIRALTVSLKALKLAGVHGIAIEVWWGIVESSPLIYNWLLYQEIFKLVSESGLKLHVALSFHSSEYLSPKRAEFIGLPPWVVEVGYRNRDIYYQDKHGFANASYLTLGVDHIPLFCGRTALQCYEDFISSFVSKFRSLMGITIEEVSIGLGPSGELSVY